jgi:hypothetical protein
MSSKKRQKIRNIPELLRFLRDRNYEVVFGWTNKKDWGLMEPDKQRIIINVELIFAELLAHEFSHIKYPDEKDENVIWEKARKIINRMTIREVREIGKTLSNSWFCQKRLFGNFSRKRKMPAKKIEPEGDKDGNT